MIQTHSSPDDIIDLSRYGLKGVCSNCSRINKRANPFETQGTCCNAQTPITYLGNTRLETDRMERSVLQRSALDIQARPIRRRISNKAYLVPKTDLEATILPENPSLGWNMILQGRKLNGSSRSLAGLAAFSRDNSHTRFETSLVGTHIHQRSADPKRSQDRLRNQAQRSVDSKSMETLRHLFIQNKLKQLEVSRFDESPPEMQSKTNRSGLVGTSSLSNFSEQVQDHKTTTAAQPNQNKPLVAHSPTATTTAPQTTAPTTTTAPKKGISALVQPIEVDAKPLSSRTAPQKHDENTAINKQFSFCVEAPDSPTKTFVTFQERPSETSEDGSVFSVAKDPRMMKSSATEEEGFEQKLEFVNNRIFQNEERGDSQKKPPIPTLALNEDALGTPSFNRSLVAKVDGAQSTQTISERTRSLTRINLPGCEAIPETEEPADLNLELRESNSSFELRINHFEIGASPPNRTDKSSQEGISTNLSLSKDPQRLESRSSLVTEDEEKEAEKIKERIRNLEQECRNFFKKRELADIIVNEVDSNRNRNEPHLVTSPRTRPESSSYSLRSASPNTNEFEKGRSTSMSPSIDSKYPGLAQFLKINRIQTESLSRIAREESEKPHVSSLLSKYLSVESQKKNPLAISGWRSMPTSNYPSNPQITLMPSTISGPTNKISPNASKIIKQSPRLQQIAEKCPTTSSTSYLSELQSHHPVLSFPVGRDSSRGALVRSRPEEKDVFVRRPIAWEGLRLAHRTDSAGRQESLTRPNVPGSHRQAVCEIGPALKGLGRNVIALRKPLGISIRRPIERGILAHQHHGLAESRQQLHK